MKRICVIVFGLVLLISSFALAEEPVHKQSSSSVSSSAICTDPDLTPTELVKRGCCSWHGGVCGCSNGRQVCCDGSYSPSSTCESEEVVVVPN